MRLIKRSASGNFVKIPTTQMGVVGDNVLYYGVLLGPFLTNGSPIFEATVESLRGILREGNHVDEVGDRDVEHLCVDGDIYFDPYKHGNHPVGVNYINDVSFFEDTLGTVHVVSDVVSGDVQFERAYTAYDGKVYRYRFQRIGNNIVYGFYTGIGQYILYNLSYDYNWKTYSSIRVYRGYSYNAWITPEPVQNSYYNLPNSPITLKGSNLEDEKLDLSSYKLLEDNFWPKDIPYQPELFGDLAMNAIQNVRSVDTNNLENLSQLMEIRKMIPKLGSLTTPAGWAGLFLWYRYGFSSTGRDVDEMVRAIRSVDESSRHYFQTVYSSKSDVFPYREATVRESYHYKVTTWPYPYAANKYARELEAWGLSLTPTNLWDLVPASFMVDWFVNVGSFLERVETPLLYSQYRIISVCRSRKVEIDVPARVLFHDDRLVGNLTFRWYKREISNHLDLPTWKIDSTQEFRNLPELTSILVQALGHK